MDELDLPAEMVVAVGEERHLRLPGLGTAGYVWQHRVEGDADVVEVSVAPVPDEDARSRADEEPVGRSVDERATIRGRQPGRIVLRLLQRRPWEREAAPLREGQVRITVDPIGGVAGPADPRG